MPWRHQVLSYQRLFSQAKCNSSLCKHKSLNTAYHPLITEKKITFQKLLITIYQQNLSNNESVNLTWITPLPYSNSSKFQTEVYIHIFLTTLEKFRVKMTFATEPVEATVLRYKARPARGQNLQRFYLNPAPSCWRTLQHDHLDPDLLPGCNIQSIPSFQSATNTSSFINGLWMYSQPQ